MSRRLRWRELASGAYIPSGVVFGFSQALPPEMHGSTDLDWEAEGGNAGGSGTQVHVAGYDHPDPWCLTKETT